MTSHDTLIPDDQYALLYQHSRSELFRQTCTVINVIMRTILTFTCHHGKTSCEMCRKNVGQIKYLFSTRSVSHLYQSVIIQ